MPDAPHAARAEDRGMTILSPDLPMLGMELAGDLRRRGFGSQLITPANGRYEAARRVWNGSVDRHPALIAECATPRDVALAIAVARERDLPLAVRGGGHSIPGQSVCDGGIVADLCGMRYASVDPANRRMRAGGGALLEDLARAGQDYGLAVPAGHISHTGIGGITTGGGVGWLQRRHGLTIDSLESVQVVTADGEVVEASEHANPDLFWGIRGGGGNFGVVTEFRFRAHPVGPVVLAGMLAFEIDRAHEAIAASRALQEQGHEDLTVFEVLAVAPPAPPFPPHLQGGPVCLLGMCWAGDVDAGNRAIAPLRALRPALDLVGPMPYLALQFMIDDTAPHGLRHYSKARWLTSDDAIGPMIDAFADAPSPFSSIILNRMGGAIGRVGADATAFAHRDAHSSAWIINSWTPEMGEDSDHVAWVRRGFDAAEPWAKGVYVNAIADEGAVRSAYPPATWDRLVEVKRRWDPENVFRLNQNIPPERAA
jgi:FAD/FMN-containing dehydrogenase